MNLEELQQYLKSLEGEIRTAISGIVGGTITVPMQITLDGIEIPLKDVTTMADKDRKYEVGKPEISFDIIKRE